MNASRDGVAFTTIPYDANWRVYVDGNQVEPYETVDALLGFDISAGKHTVELEYVHTPFVIGAIISIVGISLFVLLWLLEKKLDIRILPIKTLPPMATDTADGDDADLSDGDVAYSSEGEADVEGGGQKQFEGEPVEELGDPENNEISEENNDIPS